MPGAKLDYARPRQIQPRPQNLARARPLNKMEKKEAVGGEAISILFSWRAPYFKREKVKCFYYTNRRDGVVVALDVGCLPLGDAVHGLLTRTTNRLICKRRAKHYDDDDIKAAFLPHIGQHH